MTVGIRPEPAADRAGEPTPEEKFLQELTSNIPQEWESSEGSIESVIIAYVRALEKRCDQWGILRTQFPEDPHGPEEALYLVRTYGMTHGEHHQRWLADQVLRSLAGKRYAELRPAGWDEGVAP